MKKIRKKPCKGGRNGIEFAYEVVNLLQKVEKSGKITEKRTEMIGERHV